MENNGQKLESCRLLAPESEYGHERNFKPPPSKSARAGRKRQEKVGKTYLWQESAKSKNEAKGGVE
ncbi:MAG TPA: hypothetical protein G4O12_06350 [Dehalococcoidia bacterium]|nr:hypothetical protein [Dehalococcoidia bacterium]